MCIPSLYAFKVQADKDVFAATSCVAKQLADQILESSWWSF